MRIIKFSLPEWLSTVREIHLPGCGTCRLMLTILLDSIAPWSSVTWSGTDFRRYGACNIELTRKPRSYNHLHLFAIRYTSWHLAMRVRCRDETGHDVLTGVGYGYSVSPALGVLWRCPDGAEAGVFELWNWTASHEEWRRPHGRAWALSEAPAMWACTHRCAWSCGESEGTPPRDTGARWPPLSSSPRTAGATTSATASPAQTEPPGRPASAACATLGASAARTDPRSLYPQASRSCHTSS